MQSNNKYYVAVIGGSIAGSEAASILAQNGFNVVVIDMNALPYGKIEDGLPSWHFRMRDRQERAIDAKLNQKNIHYVPLVKIGCNVGLKELLTGWGFSAVILANGAWKDRELPVEGLEKFKDNQLVYQNDFIYWFNHKHEADYINKSYRIKENTTVLGGGLASLDVVKIVMIEKVQQALLEYKGIEVDMFTLENKGVKKILEEYQLSLKELNIKPANLVYRKRAEDMPLKTPKDNTEESKTKAKMVSNKLLEHYVDKFMFKFYPLSTIKEGVIETGKLKKVAFYKNVFINNQFETLESKVFTLDTDLLISSIGSIPEHIKDLFYDYSSLKMIKESEYQVFGFNNVFAIGNAVTGRGNIQESKIHGKRMTKEIIDNHLAKDDLELWLTNYNANLVTEVNESVQGIIKEILKGKAKSSDTIDSILKKTKALQIKAGFRNYATWIKNKTPIRLEDKA